MVYYDYTIGKGCLYMHIFRKLFRFIDPVYGAFRLPYLSRGDGVDDQMLAAIREGLANNTMQKGKNGFGLSNVNRRLKLFYGNEYGLDFQSRPGCTENIIVLPVDILW